MPVVAFMRPPASESARVYAVTATELIGSWNCGTGENAFASINSSETEHPLRITVWRVPLSVSSISRSRSTALLLPTRSRSAKVAKFTSAVLPGLAVRPCAIVIVG